MNSEDKLKWGSIQRMEEIERTLYWQGTLSRRELANKLRLSNPQTTSIIKDYNALNPGKITLNLSTKRYESHDDVDNRYYQPSFQDLSQHASAFNINATSLPALSRATSMPTLRDLCRAINQQQSVEIFYHSSRNPEGLNRRITPHTFVSNAKRTHVRAWCHQREDYRDFIIGRIKNVSNFGMLGKGILDDSVWNTALILKIKANPKLSRHKREVIEMDFQMHNGVKETTVKQALLYYYFELYNLWPEHEIANPDLQEVVLADLDIMRFL